MDKQSHPVTPAVRVLREKGIEFAAHLYDYEEHGGAGHAARSLGVPEHHVVKTLVMETDARKPLIVLMHGDREVSTKALARALGVKAVNPASAATAQKLTGYIVGGISPFGTRQQLPIYAQETIFDLPLIHINGGKRGFLVAVAPRVLRDVLRAETVNVAIAPGE